MSVRAVLVSSLLALLASGTLAQVAKPPAEKTASTAEEVVFHLPFEPGFRVEVFQGNDQAPSHNDAYNKYAFDFSPLDEGTPVVAAADGVVVYVKQDTAGPTGNWRDNNRVILKHRNGLFSEYTHIRKDGALVKVGQEVVAGDRVAESGNTGNSTRPHLHFNVLRDWQGGPSVPSHFADVEGDGVPKKDQLVTSQNVCARQLPAFRELSDELAAYALCHKLEADEAALPALAAARKVAPKTPVDAVVNLLKQRDRVLADREDEATRLRAIAELASDRGDFVEAVRGATFAVRDYADTREAPRLKALVAKLAKEEGYRAALDALAPALKFRERLAEAVALELAAAAKAAKVETERSGRSEKPEKSRSPEKSPSPIWADALRAFRRALESASEAQKAPLVEHVDQLEKLDKARTGSRSPVK